MSKIIFSHGFGVRSDARGLFSFIATAFPDFESVMFDYNTVADDGGIVVTPIDQQVKILETHFSNNEENSYLIAHSQGCIVATQAILPKLAAIILLAPPTVGEMQRVIEKMKSRPGSKINLDSVSKYPRSDGSFTYISREYIKSLDNVGGDEIYSDLAFNQNVTIVRATNDQVLGKTDFKSIDNVTVINVDTNHDFSGTGRSELVKVIKNIIK